MDGALVGAGSLWQTCRSHVAPVNNLIEFSETQLFSAKILKLLIKFIKA
jgi:hypothetical protein